MVKNNVMLSAMFAAVVFLLAGLYMPHHHHGTRICTVTEHCSGDDTDDGCHDGHDHDDKSCIEKGIYAEKKASDSGDYRVDVESRSFLPSESVALAGRNDSPVTVFYGSAPVRQLSYADVASLRRAPPVIG